MSAIRRPFTSQIILVLAVTALIGVTALKLRGQQPPNNPGGGVELMYPTDNSNIACIKMEAADYYIYPQVPGHSFTDSKPFRYEKPVKLVRG